MNMEQITSQEYFAQCESIAKDAVKETAGDRDSARDVMSETLGNHEWIIYTFYYAQILQHSSNENAYFEDFGELKAESYSDAMRLMAYAAFDRDCSEYLETALEAYEVES